MARINPKLIEALQRRLSVSQQQVYKIIGHKARERYLPRHLAAVAVAADNGITIAKYATQEELTQIRSASNGSSGGQHPQIPVQTATRAKSIASGSRRLAVKHPKGRSTSVFVVHGRNQRLRKALFSFLRSVGLQPIEWQRALALTKKASPYVGEILDAAFREAGAIVVLISPDDEARLKPEFWKQGEPAYEKRFTGQARPNVLFEAGMAMGRNPNSTVLVQVGKARPFSDIGGRHVVHLSNSAESRLELGTKLRNAGCDVNMSGTDWVTEGDFASP